MERLGIPLVQYADSAAGVRSAAERGRYATQLPSNLAEAATWDPRLAFAHGDVIGRELRDQQYNATLGGGVNLMREPRNGRTFEYLGEDPILAGKLVAEWIKGVQSNHVIGDVKHFALNDQETGRNIVNVKLDRRAARETDLLAFEIAVTEGQPGMVDVLVQPVQRRLGLRETATCSPISSRRPGVFKGFVVSDWWGTHSTVKAALAGLDNEEPNDVYFGAPLKEAVANGEVPIARLNEMVHRILRTEFAAGVVDNPARGRVVDPFRGAETAQAIAEQGSVLLKNAANLLPLSAARVKSIALIGSRADTSVPLLAVGRRRLTRLAAARACTAAPAIWFPSSPLKAIRAKAPGATVEYDSGADTREGRRVREDR